MRAVIQRVRSARVEVDGEVVGAIERGFLVLVGSGREDGLDDVAYIANKIAKMRVFHDEDGKMNLSLQQVGGSTLIVSQFTLYGDCRKGRRPSFITAMAPERAEELLTELCVYLEDLDVPVQTGRFRAMMDVHLINDGPVTLLLDSRKQF